MCSAAVDAPVSLLTEATLTPAARVIWLAARASGAPPTPTGIALSAGLTLATVRAGLAQLCTGGWYKHGSGIVERPPTEPRGALPLNLLADTWIRPQAKLVYALLHAFASPGEKTGHFAYRVLAAKAKISAQTAREVIRELSEAGWLSVSQASQRKPVTYTKSIEEASVNVWGPSCCSSCGPSWY